MQGDSGYLLPIKGMLWTHKTGLTKFCPTSVSSVKMITYHVLQYCFQFLIGKLNKFFQIRRKQKGRRFSGKKVYFEIVVKSVIINRED